MPGGFTSAVEAGTGTTLAGIGMYGQYKAGQDAAGAAQGYATAQQQAAGQVQQQTIAAAQPTALELGNMNSQLQQAQTSLQRQQKMFDSIDPAIMESGKQALQLLQGQNASTVAPMMAQRAQQRAQLQQQLQQQFGPGGSSSSAGAQALANFDLQTSGYQSQLQQQMLGTLLGESNFGAQSAQGSGNYAGQLFGQVGTQAAGIQSRLMNATFQSGQNVIGAAGAPFVGAMASAQNQGQLFGGIGKFGGQLVGYGLGGGSGGGSPSGGSGLGGGAFGSQVMAGGPMDAGGGAASAAMFA